MEVLNARTSLLSNYEVLALLRELESDYLAKAKTALRIKKEEEAAEAVVPRAYDPLEDITPNLRTVEVEAIQYLSADYQPIRFQNEAGISQLTKSLEPYGLTKSEKLQIVNLAPREAVELYVIIEELEDRLGNRMEDILSNVRASLSEPATASGTSAQRHIAGSQALFPVEQQTYEEDAEWELDANDVEFVDAGEGAGVEGDLDIEDD
ncbi:hypothetical protein EW146_g3511 [Bondarzewia mesenterica]|uniref:DNA-directed RNA polymerase III subunit RPC9 n=1 Tax=Bondarzewia mesenterica TaxID=1095465 RepID=A0A4S4LXB8_9AGAM|nr:hypothetical protein EW146_g3511 [Bondarzewia mesenterica]